MATAPIQNNQQDELQEKLITVRRISKVVKVVVNLDFLRLPWLVMEKDELVLE